MADDPVEQEEIAEAKEDNDSSGRGARWLNFKIKKQNFRYKVEALLRDSFAFAVALYLASVSWYLHRWDRFYLLLAAATVSNDDIGNLRRKAEMILNDG
eukprot:scaffold22846_cov69-Skeletonema_menzelii.AAC.1